ncbi:unnamed protein product, partial [Candidula unifasciata]
ARRLTTGLSILQTLMLLNHMFFGIRNKDDPGQFIEVLSQRIHVTSVIIGIQTAFIIFFVGLGISTLFNSIAPYPKEVVDYNKQYHAVLDFLDRMKTKSAALARTGDDSEDSDYSDESGSSESSSESSMDKDSNASNKSLKGDHTRGRRESSVDEQQATVKRVSKRDRMSSEQIISAPDTIEIPDAYATEKPAEVPSTTSFL